ncbi:MAG: aminofutalosine synthase MqnE [bacterium]
MTETMNLAHNSLYPIEDPALLDIWLRVEAGQRLQEKDGLILFQTRDISGLGWMAGRIRSSFHGNTAYFVQNRQINPSNICTLRCRFCRFSKDAGDPGAYDLEIEEILQQLSPDLTEVHVVGSLNPNRGWEYYLKLIGSIHQRLPKAGIKAWTAVEIDYFSRKFGISVEELLKQFQEAGLTMLAGGGAEVFAKRVRNILCPQKIEADRWLEIHRIAHRMGIRSNATLLYGHVETLEERVEHLLRLRALQDETGGFTAFIPLAFQPADLGIISRRVSPIEDLKTIAVSRLLLDNVPHIKAYWVMLGEETAAMALHFGADDLDGTVGEEKIAHAALAPGPSGHSREELVNTILAAEMLPVERDGLYNILNISSPQRTFRVSETCHPPSVIVGKINYLNAVPFYLYLADPGFYSLPLSPRQMGELAREGIVEAGPFSLVDYFSLESEFQLMDFCIGAKDQARSVILFSERPIKELEGAKIGITTETTTSVQLLELLLKKRYGLQFQWERLSEGGINDWPHQKGQPLKLDDRPAGAPKSKPETRQPASGCPELETYYEAVLLIGDKALRKAKYGRRKTKGGFIYHYDLGRLWREWTGLPFVFAIWAARESLPETIRSELQFRLEQSLKVVEGHLGQAILGYRHRLGLEENEVVEYLKGFSYRLGDKEREAIRTFRSLYQEYSSA